MSDFDSLFTPKYIELNERTKWLKPFKNSGWLLNKDVCINKKNNILFSIFDKNKNNKLEASECYQMYSYFDSFAAIDKNSVFDNKEIEMFLNKTLTNDNKTLKDKSVTTDDVKEFLEQVIKVTNDKYKVVPQESEIAEHRKSRLKEFTNKFNILNNETENTELLSDARFIVNEYFDKFGYLVSTSRSGVLNIELSEQEINGYDVLRFNCKYSDNPETAIQEMINKIRASKFANCGEAAILVNYIIKQKFPDKYDVSEITIDASYTNGTEAGYTSHVAVLLKNKDTNECYVIDNWIDPEGGLFKKEDWETMIQSVYQSDKINVSLEKM